MRRPEPIRRVVRAHIGELRDCYERALAVNPDLRGRIDLQFAIGMSGAVTTSAASSGNPGLESVATCAADRLRAFRFEPNPDGIATIVTMPFVFETND